MVTSLDLFAAHLVGDYVLQTDEMAKKKLADPWVRARHVTYYVIPFVPTALRVTPSRTLVFLVLLWITHFATDSKRWLPNHDWPPGTILNDQAIHLATLAVLHRVLVR